MSGFLDVKCVWCEQEARFEDPDADDKAAAAGWFQLVDYMDEPAMDFCCLECCTSWLPR